MDERVVKFRVGVMVLATIIIAGILMLVFGNLPSGWQRNITLFVKFPQAPGVMQDTPVRKSGILIGRVQKTEFADDGGVIVTLKIKQDVKLRRDEVCMVNSSLLGDSVLQFVPSSERSRATDLLNDGDYIQGRVAADPLQMISKLEGTFGQAVNSVSSASDDIAHLARNLNDLLVNNQDQIVRIVGKTERAIDGVQRAMGNMEGILGDEKIRDSLRASIADLPELLKQTRAAMDGIQSTVASADRNFRNLEDITGPLGQRGASIIGRIDDSVGRLDELLDQFVRFGRLVNNPEGSLNKIMSDPDFYQHLNQAISNVEHLTKELRPIVKDARVFTDKIARHPEMLGVRGVIERSNGTK